MNLLATEEHNTNNFLCELFPSLRRITINAKKKREGKKKIILTVSNTSPSQHPPKDAFLSTLFQLFQAYIPAPNATKPHWVTTQQEAPPLHGC